MSEGRIRRIAGDISIALIALFAVYLSVVMIFRINSVALKAGYIKMFLLELVITSALITAAADLRTGFLTGSDRRSLKITGRIIRCILALITAVVLFLSVRVIAGCFIDTSGPADHCIVLGHALMDGKPTDDLVARVETAKRYRDDNPGTKLILTGGNPDDSGMTEAEVMRGLLLGMGVSEDEMIIEDKASNTAENLRNTASIILTSPDQPVVLVTSDYHMDRAARTAKSAGFANVLRKPAPSSFLSFGANVMWEVTSELTAVILR